YYAAPIASDGSSALTSGMSTRCSLKNQTCSSFVRSTSLTTRSLVPSSPSSEARCANFRVSPIMTWWASSNRDSLTGTSSRPRGGRSICVASATSAAMARLTPPSSWMRSAIKSNQPDLLVEMLVEQQMQLVKRRARNLPVRLLVQIAQRHCVCEQLIERGGHLKPHWLFKL